MADLTPKLVEGQRARLDVGVSLACRIIGFSGPDVVLALDGPLPDDLDEPVSGYLLLEAAGRLSAVRETRSELGLRFERIDRDDRLLLASLVFSYHRR